VPFQLLSLFSGLKCLALTLGCHFLPGKAFSQPQVRLVGAFVIAFRSSVRLDENIFVLAVRLKRKWNMLDLVWRFTECVLVGECGDRLDLVRQLLHLKRLSLLDNKACCVIH